MPSVLFVCIGNVCRSPLGERLLRLRLAEEGAGDAYAVSSAGVRALRGRSMHPESIRTLEERGGSPEGFVARQITGRIADEADLILAATREVRSRLLEESPRALRRTFTLTEFVALAEADLAEGKRRAGGAAAIIERCGQARGSLQPELYDIEDPIGRSAATFDRVASVIDEQTARLAKILARESLISG
ncbi:MAG TPA: hypothetical protein VIR30_11050 [Nocardioides sp.]